MRTATAAAFPLVPGTAAAQLGAREMLAMVRRRLGARSVRLERIARRRLVDRATLSQIGGEEGVSKERVRELLFVFAREIRWHWGLRFPAVDESPADLLEPTYCCWHLTELCASPISPMGSVAGRAAATRGPMVAVSDPGHGRRERTLCRSWS